MFALTDPDLYSSVRQLEPTHHQFPPSLLASKYSPWDTGAVPSAFSTSTPQESFLLAFVHARYRRRKGISPHSQGEARHALTLPISSDFSSQVYEVPLHAIRCLCYWLCVPRYHLVATSNSRTSFCPRLPPNRTLIPRWTYEQPPARCSCCIFPTFDPFSPRLLIAVPWMLH
jgi:hypothetical protein